MTLLRRMRKIIAMLPAGVASRRRMPAHRICRRGKHRRTNTELRSSCRKTNSSKSGFVPGSGQFDVVSGHISLDAVSVSAAGLVAYRSGGANRRQLTWFDRAGKALDTVGAPDENNLTAPSLSPDGRRVAVSRRVQGNQDIWLMDADRTTRFTFDPSPDEFPIWSPDGSRIVFNSTRKGHRDVYQKPSNGAGSEELLVESPQDKAATDWSVDGRFMIYHSADPQTRRAKPRGICLFRVRSGRWKKTI